MKKVLSLVIVLAMILSSFSVAFAVPTDVVDTDYEEAVSRLTALEVIKGYEDGTFKPENTITRAEFAAVAIRALGMEDVASGTRANTKFSDVNSNHWASGYINLATAQNVIVGYPDGTFKPEAQVTYSEAITMLVRLLGYEPALTSKEWPSNFLTKAAEIGLTLGVKYNNNDPAKRGVVSGLVNKSLDIDLMDLTEVTSGDQTWGITKDTLLTKYLNVLEIEDSQVILTASHSKGSLDADEVQIEILVEGDYSKDTYTFKLSESVNANSLLGHEVTVFVKDVDDDGKLDDDDMVISLQDKTDPRDVIEWDDVDAITKKGEVVTAIYLDVLDDEYDFNNDAVIFLNYEKSTISAIEDVYNRKIAEEVSGKIILNDDDEIIFMDMANYDSPVVVTDVNVEDEKVKYFRYTETESTLRLDGEDYMVMKNGKAAELKDLAKDDVLYIWDLDTYTVLDAYDYKIEGTLQAIDSDDDYYWDYALVVEGKSIFVGVDFTISTDDNDTVEEFAIDNSSPIMSNLKTDSDRLADLEDMVGEEVTVYLNRYSTDGGMKFNGARHIVAGINTDDVNNYFVVSEAPWTSKTAGYKYYVELLNQYDKETTYEFTEDNTEFEGVELDLSTKIDGENITYVTTNYAIGALVDVEFNADGTISSISKVVDGGTYSVVTGSGTAATVIDDDYDRIKVGGKSYYVTDKTVYFGKKGSTVEAYSWADVADMVGTITEITVSLDENEIEAVLIDYPVGTTIGSKDFGYVLKREIRTDGLYVQMGVENKVVEYYAGDLGITDRGGLVERALVDFTASGKTLDDITIKYATTVGALSSTYTTSTAIGFEIVSGGVDTKNGVIEVMIAGKDEDDAATETWFIDVDKYGVDTFYYDTFSSHRVLDDKIMTLGDFSDGDIIYIYDVDATNGIYEYIALYDR